MFREVRDQFFEPRAAGSTAVGISALARPGALFEVEAIAVVPPTKACPSSQQRDRGAPSRQSQVAKGGYKAKVSRKRK